MAMNFMEAGTEIESILSNINKEKNNVANIVANAIVTRAKQGKINKSLPKDIDGILNGLTVEEKYKIMLNVAYYLANSTDYGNTPAPTRNKKKASYDNDSYDIFGRRGF